MSASVITANLSLQKTTFITDRLISNERLAPIGGLSQALLTSIQRKNNHGVIRVEERLDWFFKPDRWAHQIKLFGEPGWRHQRRTPRCERRKGCRPLLLINRAVSP
jgi:hypothetical protein